MDTSIEHEVQQYLEGDYTAIFFEVRSQVDAVNELLSDTEVAIDHEVLAQAQADVNSLWPFPPHVDDGAEEDRSIMQVRGWFQRAGSGDIEWLDDQPARSNGFQVVFDENAALEDPTFVRMRLSVWVIVDDKPVEGFIDLGDETVIERP